MRASSACSIPTPLRKSAPTSCADAEDVDARAGWSKSGTADLVRALSQLPSRHRHPHDQVLECPSGDRRRCGTEEPAGRALTDRQRQRGGCRCRRGRHRARSSRSPSRAGARRPSARRRTRPVSGPILPPSCVTSPGIARICCIGSRSRSTEGLGHLAEQAEPTTGREADALETLVGRARVAGHGGDEVGADAVYASLASYANLERLETTAPIPPQPGATHPAADESLEHRSEGPANAGPSS